MRSGDTTGTSYLGNHFASIYPLPFFGEVAPVMGVNRDGSPGVLHDNEVPITTKFIAEEDFASCDSPDGGSRASCNVDPVMERPAARAES